MCGCGRLSHSQGGRIVMQMQLTLHNLLNQALRTTRNLHLRKMKNAKAVRVRSIIAPLRLDVCLARYTFADGSEINIRDVAPPVEERVREVHSRSQLKLEDIIRTRLRAGLSRSSRIGRTRGGDAFFHLNSQVDFDKVANMSDVLKIDPSFRQHTVCPQIFG